MEIRIECSCGTPYAFEVEPVGGCMPTTVQCPSCGVDGTEAANRYLAQALTPPNPAVARVASGGTVARSPQTAQPPTRPKRAFGEPNMLLGSLGAVVGGIVAMLVWYLIIKVTNTEIGIIAWGVGIVVGVACRTLGGGYSKMLGIIAGASAFVAIVGGEYLATKSGFDEFVEEMVGTAYEARMAHAQRVVAAAKNDNELRAILVEDASEEGEVGQPAAIPDSELQRFRREDLPELQAFASGSPPRQQFERALRSELNSAEMKALVLRESVSVWTLLWLFLGVGSAYKLGTGENE